MNVTCNSGMTLLSQEEIEAVDGGIVIATLVVWAACSFVAGATLTIAAYAATHQN